MESQAEGERFLATSENLSYHQVMSEIARHLGRKAPNIRIGGFLRQLAWRSDWLWSRLSGKAPVITRETALTTSSTYYFDNTKSKETFDFDYIPLSETIADTAIKFMEAAEDGFESRVLPLR